MQIGKYTASNEGEGLQNQREHHICLTKYEAVDLTAVSELLIRDSIIVKKITKTWTFYI